MNLYKCGGDTTEDLGTFDFGKGTLKGFQSLDEYDLFIRFEFKFNFVFLKQTSLMSRYWYCKCMEFGREEIAGNKKNCLKISL